MESSGFSPILTWRRARQCFKAEAALATLTLIMIAVFHATAAEDRLLLNLYYIGILAGSYALVKRRALALAVLVILVTAGTTMTQVYLSAEGGRGDPLLTPLGNVTSLFVLLFLAWRLGKEAYHFQSEEHRLQVQRQIEEKALATRAAALASTSHEVRQPLTAISTITETLLDGTAGPLSELQHEFMVDVDESVKHLMDLINDILDHAKAEAGMIELARETIALPAIVDQCVGMVASKAAAAEVTITVDVEPEAGEILADPLRLRQILINLLSNAVKFNARGGLVEMQVRGDTDDVLITVRDTGKGIREEQLDRLFDPYYQASHGDQGMGTGLGLAIIKQLVELHEGSISVKSKLNSGSTFTVRLPKHGAFGDDTASALAGSGPSQVTGDSRSRPKVTAPNDLTCNARPTVCQPDQLVAIDETDVSQDAFPPITT